MAIDGLGGSTPPLTPPIEPNTPPNEAKGTSGAPSTAGTAGAVPLASVAPQSPVAVVANVISPAISAPKPNSTPLDRPKLVLPSQATSLSVGDLIQLIQAEVQKTSEALAQAQNSQIKQDSLRQQAANNDQIKALNAAADQIIEIQKQQKAMEIANWCMTAFAIFMTVCTAGTLGVIGGPLMIAGTVATQVPIEGKNVSGWLTEGVGEGIGQMQKAIVRKTLEDRGITPTQEAMDKFNSEIENNQDYYAMAILITIQVGIAVAISVATFGAGAPTAAGGGATAVANTSTSAALNVASKAAETTMKEATQAATKVVETAVKETTKAVQKSAEIAVQEVTNASQKVVQETVKQTAEVTQKVTEAAVKATTKSAEMSITTLEKAQKAFNLAQTIGTTAKDLAMSGASIHTAVLQEENSENMANADKVKAYVKFLQQILKSDQEFLKELLEMQANIANTTKSILQTEHSTNMHIANLATNA